jgi:hypothetical protein
VVTGGEKKFAVVNIDAVLAIANDEGHEERVRVNLRGIGDEAAPKLRIRGLRSDWPLGFHTRWTVTRVDGSGAGGAPGIICSTPNQLYTVCDLTLIAGPVGRHSEVFGHEMRLKRLPHKR